MTAKLNLNKHYGVIYGDHAATYEQDGKRFTANFEELVEQDSPSEPQLAADPGQPVEASLATAIQAFLRFQLKEGRMPKSNLYKLASDEGFTWSDVTSEAAAMRIEITNNRGAELWKLPAD